MIAITKENLTAHLTEEDQFSLKILADRYMLKDSEATPKAGSPVVVELDILDTEGNAVLDENGHKRTIKEVAIVTGYSEGTYTIALFTGERGTQVDVKKEQMEVLLEYSDTQVKQRIAKALSGGDERLQSDLEELVLDKIIFGGRILAGAGTDQELTYFNCYVLDFIHDSRGGISKHRENVMEVMSRGGGVGTNGSTLRPSKTKVHKVRGRSSGAVSWLHDLSELTHLVEQGGSRRGAQMIALADWHPDLIDFITAKAQKPLKADLTVNGEKKTIKFGKVNNQRLTGANISVLISDKFMETAKQNGDWKLRFPDVANYTSEQMEIYDDKWAEIGDPDKFHEETGLAIKTHAVIPARDILNLIGVASHGSAEPGTLFLERANKFSNTWYFNPLICTNPCITGDTLISTVEGKITVKELAERGENIDVYTMNDNEELTIRPGYDFRKTGVNKKILKVTTGTGKSIRVTELHPVYVQGKGWVDAQDLKVGDKLVELQEIMGGERYKRIKLSSQKKYTKEHRFIAGHYEDIEGMDVHHLNEDTLDNRLSNFEVMTHSEHSKLTNIGHKNYADQCSETGRFLPAETKKKKEQLQLPASQGKSTKIVSIVEDGYEDVYNFEVEEFHNYVANGVIVHNCGEQFLSAWSVCNLGHINLSKFVKWDEELNKYIMDWSELQRATKILTRALDNVIDATPYYFDINKKQQESERRLGLGTLGVDEALKLMGYDYGEPTGRSMAEDIFRDITRTAYYESVLLATEKGAFPQFDADKYLQSEFMEFMAKEDPELIGFIKSYGIRNATIITQAPTGTTGTMAQTSTGIEPFFAGEFYRSSRIGFTKQTAPVIKRMQEKGMDTSKLKYAGDYTTKQHLDFQAVAQKWCDSSISKTINAPKGTTVEDVTELMEYAYQIGLKGFTVYVDSSRDTQVLSTEKDSNEPAQEVAVEESWKRDGLLTGRTHKIETSYGRLYVTFNRDETGKLREVFFNIGKAGSDVLATLEGYGRLLSLMLQNSQIPEEDVIKQLSGIQGSNPYGFGPNKVLSIPDAISVAFKREMSVSTPEKTIEVTNKDTCSCGAPLIFVEGCIKCEACGNSKCN